jgi:hypothetical protein
VFNTYAPEFSKDFSENITDVAIPLISHEIGQYSVYPDINEIKEYKGNLVPANFIAVKESLAKNGLLKLAPSFLQASGKFSSLLYKEEIERALKTKGFDGFQLLQLQDFPGQGTALVGLLNAFWKSKGFTTANDFKKFCSEVTLLARFAKAVYTNNELFEAGVEIANFYKPLNGAEVVWAMKDDKGAVIRSGSFGKKDFIVDNGQVAGKIVVDLRQIQTAKRLFLEVAIKGTQYKNQWSVWVYPSTLTMDNGSVAVTSSLQEATAALNAGKKVLLCPLPDTLMGPKGKFVPVFWSPIHFPKDPGTMGLLIKSKHKALEFFPTDDHSNWQWWDLTTKGKAMKLASLPDGANIVRPIDNFVTNDNLTSLFEARVGKGQLLFCSMDIVTDLEKRPQARQLRHSLLTYMNGNGFSPSFSMEYENLSALFKK